MNEYFYGSKTLIKKRIWENTNVRGFRDSRNMKFNSQSLHYLLGNAGKTGRYGIQSSEAFVNF